MGYERKYKLAPERARQFIEHPLQEDSANIVEYIFPELKESEDERIRKEILNVFKQLDEGTTICGRKYDYAKWIAWLEKQGEQMTKPKFHEGDWITDGSLTCKVLSITGKSYELHLYNDDYCHFETDIQSVDKYYRLWTIQDAKDSDVLVCDINKAEIGGDIEKLPNITPTICIYQNVVKDKDYIHTYCSLYNESSLMVSNSMYYNTFVYNIHPATKEQRDLLFSKMKEVGYEWDSVNKELKKIKVASKESEDEKMRKELIAFLEENLSLGYPDETWDSKGLKRWIAWLEKQGEKKLTENTELQNYISNVTCLVNQSKKDFGL